MASKKKVNKTTTWEEAQQRVFRDYDYSYLTPGTAFILAILIILRMFGPWVRDNLFFFRYGSYEYILFYEYTGWLDWGFFALVVILGYRGGRKKREKKKKEEEAEESAKAAEEANKEADKKAALKNREAAKNKKEEVIKLLKEAFERAGIDSNEAAGLASTGWDRLVQKERNFAGLNEQQLALNAVRYLRAEGLIQ